MARKVVQLKLGTELLLLPFSALRTQLLSLLKAQKTNMIIDIMSL